MEWDFSRLKCVCLASDSEPGVRLRWVIASSAGPLTQKTTWRRDWRFLYRLCMLTSILQFFVMFWWDRESLTGLVWMLKRMFFIDIIVNPISKADFLFIILKRGSWLMQIVQKNRWNVSWQRKTFSFLEGFFIVLSRTGGLQPLRYT